ncbi:MAG: phosphatase PAP2 family protein [Propionibacteriaceae bacterium]|jgi:diacylglycerol kinase family enzyme/membrane-associated phospholipid phosphatase|nr:phosphatase PAP2 family protein [Propionibacteriaceae bacterium]
MRWVARSAIACGVAFLLIAVLVATVPAVSAFDEAMTAPMIAPASALGQILQAIAILTTGWTTELTILLLAWWAYRRRLRRLSWAMIAAGALGAVGFGGVKALIRRERPLSSFAETLTYSGWSFPSGHVTCATILAVLAVHAYALRRAPVTQLWAARLIAVFAVGLVAVNRWAMNCHWFTDILGGVFLGAALSLGALAVARQPVASRIPSLSDANAAGKRAVVIYNPAKVTDYVLFRSQVDFAFQSRGWARALWLETTPEETGAGLAAEAVRRHADLVIVSGGDGTVRAVCAALAGTTTPLAIVPSGTGNLLARNLGVPLDIQGALDVAFDGVPSAIDMIRITTADFDDYSVVIAGMGLDAATMRDTRDDLKRVFGNGAYIISVLQQRGDPSFSATIRVDNGPAFVRDDAITILFGNVPGVQVPVIHPFPAAEVDDGRLDLLIGHAENITDWAKAGVAVVTNSPAPLTQETMAGIDESASSMEYIQAKCVTVTTEKPVAFQIDGDVAGTTTELTATIDSGALRVMTPKSRPAALAEDLDDDMPAILD